MIIALIDISPFVYLVNIIENVLFTLDSFKEKQEKKLDNIQRCESVVTRIWTKYDHSFEKDAHFGLMRICYQTKCI
jgi:hypothetical protein